MRQRDVPHAGPSELGRDIFVRAVAVFVVLALLPYVFPLLSPEAMTWFSDSVALPTILALGVWALLQGLGDIPDRRERTFWQLLAGALTLYLAAKLFDWVPWSTETADLVVDFLYVGFYTSLLLAVQVRPDRPRGPRGLRAERLEVAATLVFLATLAAYYLVIPGIGEVAEYESWVPSMLLFGILDCIVLARMARLWGTTGSRRWRALYGLLLVPVTLWLVVDAIEALGWLRVIPVVQGGTPLDFLWLAPEVLLVVIVRMRHQLPMEPAGVTADGPAGHLGQPGASAVVGYAIVLAAMQLTLDLTGVMGPADRSHREVVILVSLPILLAIAYALERTLARRTRALDLRGRRLEHQLQESQRVEALGTLAGGVAHEFNNLLTVVMGFAQLHQEDLDARGEDSGDLGQIVEAVERGRLLTSQILAFSRRQDVIRGPVDLSALLEDAVQVLRVTLPASVNVGLHVDPGCGQILADPQQIRQVVLNLATNASHAMGGSGTLEIRLFQQDAPPEHISSLWAGPCAVLVMRDDGAGMDATTMTRVFEPFFTTQKLGRGTGLGLAVVHGIVASHGGAIQVESEPGDGTEFRIYLPVYAPVGCETESGSPVRPVSRTDSRGSGAVQVLVVEDDISVAGTTCYALSLAGFEAVPARSVREALASLESDRGRWDVAVVSDAMPDRTGLDLVADLRERGIVLPVILVTDFPLFVSKEQAQAAGVADVLAKPFTSRMLLRSVRTALKVD